jgi:hypothetical protein
MRRRIVHAAVRESRVAKRVACASARDENRPPQASHKRISFDRFARFASSAGVRDALLEAAAQIFFHGMVGALTTLFLRGKIRTTMRLRANFASSNLVAGVQKSGVESVFLTCRSFQRRNLFFCIECQTRRSWTARALTQHRVLLTCVHASLSGNADFSAAL